MAVKASCTVTLSCYRDTQSVTRYYKLQSSTASAPAKPTANPPSGWTDAEPSYTSGSTNTLYFCDLTVFSDGTWAYSTVSKSSSYEAAKEAYNKAQNAQDTIDNLEIGGRNYILNSANLSVSGLGSVDGSRAEYRYINVGQSYMNIPSGTEVAISFDLEMSVNSEKPTLDVYNTDKKGPKKFPTHKFRFTASSGDTIKKRCSFVTTMSDRSDATLPDNYIEFYSIYGTSNWFKISNLKLEIGNRATDWTPAPEDIENKVDDTSNEIYEVIRDREASITNTFESVILQALESYTKTSDYDSFKKTVESQLELLSDQMTLNFTETIQQIEAVNGDLQTKFNTITKYFTFDVDGLTIGQADNPFKVVIDNDRYSMLVNGVEVLWLDPDGKSNIPELSVTRTFNLLGLLIDKDSNGNVNIG